MALDAFGRLRTSECFTTFSYYPSLLTDNSSLDIDTWVTLTGGSGSATYNSNNYINMSVSTTNDYVVRITKQPMEYQPGKSRLVYITGTMLGENVNGDTLTTRLGLFNIDDSTPPEVREGVYFQTDGTNLQWVETTQVATTTVNQSSWNVDTFDGSGPSGKTLTSSDLQVAMLYVIDQEWLGVGRIRVGFIIEGIIYYAHAFNHSLSVQYTTTPRQRICYQINGTSISSGPHTMRQMCSTAISESGYFPLCPRIAVGTNSNGVTMTTAGEKYILLGLTLQSSYVNGLIKLLGSTTSYAANTGKTGFYEIQLHSSNGSIGSINGSLTYSSIPNSISQFAIGDGTQTINSDGFILSAGFTSGQTNAIIVRTPNDTLLTRTMCTSYDTFYLIGSGNANNDQMFATLEFIESI